MAADPIKDKNPNKEPNIGMVCLKSTSRRSLMPISVDWRRYTSRSRPTLPLQVPYPPRLEARLGRTRKVLARLLREAWMLVSGRS